MTTYRAALIQLRTPDEQLVAIARGIPRQECANLYHRLAGLRLTWLERVLARAAGLDADALRRRFLLILEAAALPA